MKKNKKNEVKPYVKTSSTVARAKTKTFSPTSMKIITYGLYKLAYSFDLDKYKSYNLLNKKNWKEEMWDDFTCTFTTKEFCDSLGLSDGGQQRKQIESAIDKAFDEKIKLSNENETRWFPWFVEALYYHPKGSELENTDVEESKDKSISLTFHPGVLAIALNQASGYAYIDLQSYGKLKSTYALKWYQIIKSRYNMKGKWGNAYNQWTTEEMTIKDLKDMFNIGLNLYEGRTNNLLTKVLKNPIKEINDSGFNFTAEIVYKRGQNNRVESFLIVCTETMAPRVLSRAASKEEKEIARENDKNDLKVERMKKKYPEEWENYKKTVSAKSSMPLFTMFVDQEILSKMLEDGFEI